MRPLGLFLLIALGACSSSVDGPAGLGIGAGGDDSVAADDDLVPDDPPAGDPDEPPTPIDTGPDVDRSEAKLYTVSKKPSELDASVMPGSTGDAHDDTQYAYLDTRAEPEGRLVIFLVGATSSPGAGQTMGRYLAGLGFHVVVPAYANAYGVGVCSANVEDDVDCHGKVRLEALEGVDHSPHIEVDRADSAEGRVIKLLEHLRDNEPFGDWGYYLDATGAPKWSKIVITGHSHGASSAGVYAKHRAFERAVMLSGPFDSYAGEPASWTMLPPMTPLAKTFGFSHQLEDQYSGHLEDWEAMQVPGAVVDVGDVAPPYNGSHRLKTHAAPRGNANNGTYHGSTFASGSSPMNGTYYVYDAAWRYLYGVD